MNYKHIKHIDKDKDLIISCRKGDLKELQSLISIDNIDFEGEHSIHPHERHLREQIFLPNNYRVHHLNHLQFAKVVLWNVSF